MAVSNYDMKWRTKIFEALFSFFDIHCLIKWQSANMFVPEVCDLSLVLYLDDEDWEQMEKTTYRELIKDWLFALQLGKTESVEPLYEHFRS